MYIKLKKFGTFLVYFIVVLRSRSRNRALLAGVGDKPMLRSRQFFAQLRLRKSAIPEPAPKFDFLQSLIQFQRLTRKKYYAESRRRRDFRRPGTEQTKNRLAQYHCFTGKRVRVLFTVQRISVYLKEQEQLPAESLSHLNPSEPVRSRAAATRHPLQVIIPFETMFS